MSNEEVIKRLSAYITCLKCEISGKECDDNCRYQYEAGTMGEIVEALETLIRAEPQYHIEDKTRTLWIKIEHGALEKVNRIFVEDGEWCKPFYVGRM